MVKDTIVRRHLLSAALGSRTVTQVEVREIIFAPGQQTGRHSHPCPVVGYIAEGTALFQREGEPEAQTLKAGSAFHEPADAVIARFDNASSSQPMKFIAYYLLNGDQPLIQMLPQA
jgi:quercetin dioxygenase-like cupin family protein